MWPVDDFSKKTELRLASDERAAQQQWWPDGREVAFAGGRHVDGTWRDRRIERWDPATGAQTVLLAALLSIIALLLLAAGRRGDRSR